MKRYLWVYGLVVFSGDPLPGKMSRGEAILVHPRQGVVTAGVVLEKRDQDIALVFFNPDGSIKNSIRTKRKGNEGVYAIGLHQKEKILVAGYTEKRKKRFPVLLRYLADGKLDPAFGNGGAVQTDLGGSAESHFMAIAPDQKVLVAGFVKDKKKYKMFVLRYEANGLMERRFDDVGIDGRAYGLALQKDGKIVVAGAVESQERGEEAVVVRYLPNGKIETAFGKNGVAILNFSPGQDVCSSVAVQKDGKIVVAGFSVQQGKAQKRRQSDLFVARLKKNGDWDKTFNQTGFTLFDQNKDNDVAHAIEIKNNKILIAGEVARRMALLIFDDNGKLIQSTLADAPKKGGASAEAMALQKGKVFLTGYSENRWIIVRSTGDVK